MPDNPSPAARPHDKYERLIERASKHPAMATAVAHPCDAVSLESAVEAAKLGLLKPDPGRPAARITRGRGTAGLDISAFDDRRIPSTATNSAAKAVELVTARPRRGPDEGQPAHRRTDGRRGGA